MMENIGIFLLLLFWLHKTVYVISTIELDNDCSERFIPCEDDWYFFGDKCYKIEGYENSDVPLSWEKASVRCSKMDGKLVSVHSQEENDFLTTFLVLKSKQPVFIGLSDQRKNSNFTWEDGSPLDYENWQPEHTKHLKEACVAISPERNTERAAGKWVKESCKLLLAYACKKDSNSSHISPNPQYCPSNEGCGWKFHDSCYKIISHKRTWKDAEQYCQVRYNGHLVKILDASHDIFLNYLLSSYSDPVWIGIKTKKQYRQKWISGWYVTYEKLNKNIEDIESNQCILRWNGTIWKSSGCGEKHTFICERSSVQAPELKQPTYTYRCPGSTVDLKDNIDGRYCYYVDTKRRLTWFEAQEECFSIGGMLASVTSKNVEKQLSILSKGEDVNIGLNRLLTNGRIFIWSDTSKLNYTSWGQNEPHKGFEKCVLLRSTTMTWHDHDCSRSIGFICEVPKEIIPENFESDSESTCNLQAYKYKKYNISMEYISCEYGWNYIGNSTHKTEDLRFCSLGEGGELKFQNSSYNIVTDSMSWNDAEHFCQNIYNGHLVSILDFSQETFLDYVLKPYRIHPWIGIKKKETYQQMWASKWPVLYEKFDEKLEDVVKGSCFLKWNRVFWTSTDCEEKHPFICEKSTDVAPILTQAPPNHHCPKIANDWRDLEGEFCYYIDTKSSVTWFEAQIECFNRGGFLTSINSEEEARILHYMIKGSEQTMFIGLNSLLTNGDVYVWPDGSKPTHTYWSADEPNNKQEMCVAVYPSSMEWNDVPCNSRSGFICQARKKLRRKTTVAEL